MSWSTWSRQWTRTFCALMVMPRSRSMSIESRYCALMSRGSTASVSSKMRSDSVDLPWSTWLMIEKLRMTSGATTPSIVPSQSRCAGRSGLLIASEIPEAVRLLSVRVEGSMANIKSQIKRNRQNERRRVKNKAVRSELKTRTKNALIAAETGAEDSAERLREAVKRIDKAAAKGVIHANQASRRKSRLVRRISLLTSEADEAS